GDRAQRVEGLSEVEPPLGALGRAEHGDEGVGGSLEKREAARDHEERKEEEAIRAQVGGRVEEKGAQREERQPDDDARLVPVAAHEEPRGDREQEVAEIKRGLHQTGLEVRELERLLELADQDIVEIVGDPPEEKETDDEHERQDALASCRCPCNVTVARGFRLTLQLNPPAHGRSARRPGAVARWTRSARRGLPGASRMAR